MNILLVEPQKSKKYYTPYPPLALLKLSAFHKKMGDSVKFVRGFSHDNFVPKKIYITSLFTYAYEGVHETIRFYQERYKASQIIVGGIYATLCPEHLKDAFGDSVDIHSGLFDPIDNIMPDYSLVPDWSSSILFSSRGCIRKCPFCSVPLLEPKFEAKKSIKHLIYRGHKKIIFWDNNILASPFWENIFDELEELPLKVDFNQGVDARLLTEHVAIRLKRLELDIIRLAYDSEQIRSQVQKAINTLKRVGFRGREIIVYCLHNHHDSPEDFLSRIKDLLEWDVVSYPMRYEPLVPTNKNKYIAPNWTVQHLEMLADARRVIGFGGAFPPYEGLKKKILNAKSFERAFGLRRRSLR